MKYAKALGVRTPNEKISLSRVAEALDTRESAMRALAKKKVTKK